MSVDGKMYFVKLMYILRFSLSHTAFMLAAHPSCLRIRKLYFFIHDLIKLADGNPPLLHGVSIANSDAVILQGLEVNCDTERYSHFISSAVATAHCSTDVQLTVIPRSKAQKANHQTICSTPMLDVTHYLFLSAPWISSALSMMAGLFFTRGNTAALMGATRRFNFNTVRISPLSS